MKFKFFPALIAAILFSVSANSQQTIGLFFNDSLSFNGYTLFSPLNSKNTYLIDNCGYEIHRWTSSYNPGDAVYLLANGNLLRTAKVSSGTFNGGGIGGRVEEFDWNNNLIWSYNYATSLVHQHHDVEALPNGNILLVAWEYKSQAEAIAQGRNASTVGTSLWPEHIVEVQKVGTTQGNIVWEWHCWDHLVQDYDNTKPNYGVVAHHPELIDLNFTSGGGGPGGNSDWMHFNSVAYNERFDQILISNHNFGEVWIIDHSSTTAEASGHSGGTFGKGGDLLYRFGNPQVYDRGNAGNQIFSGQHNAVWIPDDYPNAGKIMVFNNGGGGNQASAVDIFEPPVNSVGVYTNPGSNAYGPAAVDWRYTATGFYSSNISGAQAQPNGNILICEGASGNFFEVTPGKQTVWNYVNPVAANGVLSQGANATQNNVFRAERYAPDYGAFTGRTLTAGQPIELNPLPSTCRLHVDSSVTTTNIATNTAQNSMLVKISNPFHNELMVWNAAGDEYRVQLFSIAGEKMLEQYIFTENYIFNTARLAPGVYLARIITDAPVGVYNLKVVKQ